SAYSISLRPTPHPLIINSFPTRRSSDLSMSAPPSPDPYDSNQGRPVPPPGQQPWTQPGQPRPGQYGPPAPGGPQPPEQQPSAGPDRKSTRLNYSHVSSSYAYICLK